MNYLFLFHFWFDQTFWRTLRFLQTFSFVFTKSFRTLAFLFCPIQIVLRFLLNSFLFLCYLATIRSNHLILQYFPCMQPPFSCKYQLHFKSYLLLLDSFHIFLVCLSCVWPDRHWDWSSVLKTVLLAQTFFYFLNLALFRVKDINLTSFSEIDRRDRSLFLFSLNWIL